MSKEASVQKSLYHLFSQKANLWQWQTLGRSEYRASMASRVKL